MASNVEQKLAKKIEEFDALKKQIRALQTERNTKARKLITRKKIIYGSPVYAAKIEGNLPPEIEEWILARLNDKDRAVLEG